MFDESKKYHKEEVVEYTCDMCGKTFHRMYKQLLKSRQTHNRTQDFCRSCSASLCIIPARPEINSVLNSSPVKPLTESIKFKIVCSLPDLSSTKEAIVP